MKVLRRTGKGSEHAPHPSPGPPRLFKVKKDYVTTMLPKRVYCGLGRTITVVDSVEINLKTSCQCLQQMIAADLAARIRGIRGIGSEHGDSHGDSPGSSVGLIPLA
jgi:hypothetical protein